MGLTFAFDADEPVGDDRNGRGDGVFDRQGHQKPLAVTRDIIAVRNVGRIDLCLKERFRRTGLERRACGIHIGGHELAVRAQEKQFFAVTAPARSETACVDICHFPPDAGKGCT